MKKKKIVVGAATVLLTAFAVWNIIWYQHYKQYRAFRDKTEKMLIGGREFYQIRYDDYLFNVIMPEYLKFNGNLAVDKTIPGHEQSEISMLVWLKLFGEDEYGIILNASDGSAYQIYMDSQGNPVFEDDDENNYKNDIQSLISKNQELIKETYNAWDTVFGIRN